jgi:hypothetical protein
MKITREILKYIGACRYEREKFLRIWPDGLELTRENLALVKKYELQIWLPGADLRMMDLSGLDLSGAELTGVGLSGTDLYGACLIDANLSGANLSGSDLTGANLGDWERGPDGYARRKGTA